jgi:hypothetical protein
MWQTEIPISFAMLVYKNVKGWKITPKGDLNQLKGQRLNVTTLKEKKWKIIIVDWPTRLI